MFGTVLYEAGSISVADYAYTIPVSSLPVHHWLSIREGSVKSNYALCRGELNAFAKMPIDEFEAVLSARFSTILPQLRRARVCVSDVHSVLKIASSKREESLADLENRVTAAANRAANMCEAVRPGPEFYSPEEMI